MVVVAHVVAAVVVRVVGLEQLLGSPASSGTSKKQQGTTQLRGHSMPGSKQGHLMATLPWQSRRRAEC